MKFGAVATALGQAGTQRAGQGGQSSRLTGKRREKARHVFSAEVTSRVDISVETGPRLSDSGACSRLTQELRHHDCGMEQFRDYGSHPSWQGCWRGMKR